MKTFAALFDELDSSTSTLHKVAAMEAYFRSAPPDDAAWAIYFLSGQRLKRLVGYRFLRTWALEVTGLSEWLFDDCYSAVGDLAETVSLLLDTRDAQQSLPVPLSTWLKERILPLAALDETAQRAAVVGFWKELHGRELFLINKLLTGEFRVGVSAILVTRALSSVAGVPTQVITQRLMGSWQPDAAFFQKLMAQDSGVVEDSAPYPFALATQLDVPVETLGDVGNWQLEWKWDGIRAQIIRRKGLHIWTRGEELVTPRFPELHAPLQQLPEGTVLDGEILAFSDGKPLPFAVMQKRTGRVKLSAKILNEAPVALIAYDLLELNGEDIRSRPLSFRREKLEELVKPLGPVIGISEALTAPSWEAFATLRSGSRERGVEGLMLKKRASPYGTGRHKGDWWKWKIEPFTMDAVLVYAQSGSGKRGGLFTDYTFAVWKDGELLPVAKAYSGLNDDEIATLDKWIRANTLERFGPVRSVPPTHVFEIAFEAIAPSPRHKAGIAVRFPRIARWRMDKLPKDADTVETLLALLNSASP